MINLLSFVPKHTLSQERYSRLHWNAWYFQEQPKNYSNSALTGSRGIGILLSAFYTDNIALKKKTFFAFRHIILVLRLDGGPSTSLYVPLGTFLRAFPSSIFVDLRQKRVYSCRSEVLSVCLPKPLSQVRMGVWYRCWTWRAVYQIQDVALHSSFAKLARLTLFSKSKQIFINVYDGCPLRTAPQRKSQLDSENVFFDLRGFLYAFSWAADEGRMSGLSQVFWLNFGGAFRRPVKRLSSSCIQLRRIWKKLRFWDVRRIAFSKEKLAYSKTFYRNCNAERYRDECGCVWTVRSNIGQLRRTPQWADQILVPV